MSLPTPMQLACSQMSRCSVPFAEIKMQEEGPPNLVQCRTEIMSSCRCPDAEQSLKISLTSKTDIKKCLKKEINGFINISLHKLFTKKVII